MNLKSIISEHRDFPKPGILFRDFAPILYNPQAMKFVIDRMESKIPRDTIDVVAGIESRGFILGTAMALRYGKGFVMIRKAGKTPGITKKISYDIEYGSDTMEVRQDAIRDGQRVLICDDLLATGGTARAAADLVESVGGRVAAMAFIIELDSLGGRDKISKHAVHSLVNYP